ncbi:low temperature requirement protein A [Halomarina rubra]|uniref:Low temperature requirement protein A n=1 Tax=Halomarina rubra TaxID=2071873 RepID=A0ABD6ATA4_9EURY|nr:low temperature requirement protein A [Halomarina rubra]
MRAVRFHPRGVRRPVVRPPAVYGDSDSPRHATWLELFFDLVFVVALAELGLFLHHHLTPMGLVQFAGLFAIVWWVWLAISYYCDTYDTDDGLSNVVLVVAMFAVIFLSATIEDSLSGGSFAFAAAVLALRGITTGLHLRAQYLDTEARPFVLSWIGLEVLVTSVWALSLLVPEPGRFGLWIASYVISLAGISVVYLGFETIVVQISHFPERLGLFTILVLGETILAVAVGTSVPEWGPRILVLCASGFAIAVAVWWLYFEHFDDEVIDRVLTDDGDWRLARQEGLSYIFAHYPVHAGIIAIGVGVEAAIEATLGGTTMGLSERVAICAGVGAFLLGSSVAQRVIEPPLGLDDRSLAARLGVVVFLVLLGVLGEGLVSLVVVGLVAASLAGLMTLERTGGRAEQSPARVEI